MGFRARQRVRPFSLTPNAGLALRVIFLTHIARNVAPQREPEFIPDRIPPQWVPLRRIVRWPTQ